MAQLKLQQPDAGSIAALLQGHGQAANIFHKYADEIPCLYKVMQPTEQMGLAYFFVKAEQLWIKPLLFSAKLQNQIGKILNNTDQQLQNAQAAASAPDDEF